MNICLICKSKERALADSMLNAGQTHAAVARRLGVDRQVVGRHVRNGHVIRGNPAAGTAWMKPQPVEPEDDVEPTDDEIAAYEAANLAAEDLALALHGVDPKLAAEHRAHVAANVAAQDWQANVDDACPAAMVVWHPAMDALADAVATYRKATLG